MNLSVLNTVCFHEQLKPVICRLISSLERFPISDTNWIAEILPSHHLGPSPSPECNANGLMGTTTLTKSPLLGKPSKQEKKKMKDLVIEIRENASEEHNKTMKWGIKIDIETAESNDQGLLVNEDQ